MIVVKPKSHQAFIAHKACLIIGDGSSSANGGGWISVYRQVYTLVSPGFYEHCTVTISSLQESGEGRSLESCHWLSGGSCRSNIDAYSKSWCGMGHCERK